MMHSKSERTWWRALFVELHNRTSSRPPQRPYRAFSLAMDVNVKVVRFAVSTTCNQSKGKERQEGRGALFRKRKGKTVSGGAGTRQNIGG